MRLNAQQVHVWEMNLCVSGEKLQNNLLYLSKDELIRAKRLHSVTHQQRFINARATLRKILAQYLAIAPEAIRFSYNSYHKPAIQSPHTSICFNLSHSENCAIYAVTKGIEVGIDIEKLRPTNYQAIAKRCFSLSEIRALAISDNDEDVFFRLWSRKEALLKGIGKGSAIVPASFSVPTEAKGGQVQLANFSWHLISLNQFPGFAASLATSQPIEYIYYYKLDPALGTGYAL